MDSKATYTNTRYGKGSTGFHTAFPAQQSDGRSGGMPLCLNIPLMRKPAVLATCFPESSHGTPGTAICAVIYHPGPALPGQQCGDGGVEPRPANRWKTMVIRTKAKVKQWQAHIHRYYLTLMCKHMALTPQHTFSYVRLIVFTIGISRWSLFRKSALPYGAATIFARNRRFALFRRWAELAISGNRLEYRFARPVA